MSAIQYCALDNDRVKTAVPISRPIPAVVPSFPLRPIHALLMLRSEVVVITVSMSLRLVTIVRCTLQLVITTSL